MHLFLQIYYVKVNVYKEKSNEKILNLSGEVSVSNICTKKNDLTVLTFQQAA